LSRNFYKIYLKRGVDITLGGALLIVLIPIWLIVALAISVDSKGSIFFTQRRLGYAGKTFLLYKFRTMRVNENRVESQVFKEHPDISALGVFLRRFKIDETPQLLNVLKGDMSLIGPRPCLPSLRKRFDHNGELRLEVKPGLSGWAQVNGNIYNSWVKRWEYDAFYAKNVSFFLDLKILKRTFWVVLFGEENK